MKWVGCRKRRGGWCVCWRREGRRKKSVERGTWWMDIVIPSCKWLIKGLNIYSPYSAHRSQLDKSSLSFVPISTCAYLLYDVWIRTSELLYQENWLHHLFKHHHCNIHAAWGQSLLRSDVQVCPDPHMCFSSLVYRLSLYTCVDARSWPFSYPWQPHFDSLKRLCTIFCYVWI